MALNILVFGCTGQDGSYLIKSLLKKGHKIVGISRAQEINKSKHEQLGIKDELEIIRNIFNDAWSENWGFIPFGKTEFQTIGRVPQSAQN